MIPACIRLPPPHFPTYPTAAWGLFFALFAPNPSTVALSQYTIDLALSTNASSKSWSGYWDTFGYIIDTCKQKRYQQSRSHWKTPPNFLSFKISTFKIYLQSQSHSLSWGKQIPAFGAFVAGPQNLSLPCWRHGHHHMKQSITWQSKARPSQQARSSKRFRPAPT